MHLCMDEVSKTLKMTSDDNSKFRTPRKRPTPVRTVSDRIRVTFGVTAVRFRFRKWIKCRSRGGFWVASQHPPPPFEEAKNKIIEKGCEYYGRNLIVIPVIFSKLKFSKQESLRNLPLLRRGPPSPTSLERVDETAWRCKIWRMPQVTIEWENLSNYLLCRGAGRNWLVVTLRVLLQY